MNYMPIERELIKLPKQWIVNMAYTLIGDDFFNWMMMKVQERNQKVIKDRDLMITVDPEIMAAWQASTAVACKFILVRSFFYFIIIHPKCHAQNQTAVQSTC